MKSNPTLVLLVILALGAFSPLFGESPVSFNGALLKEVVAAKGRTGEAMQPGEVVLLPSGLSALALEAAEEEVSLWEFFGLRGWDFIGPVGPEGALLAARDSKPREAFLVVGLAPRHRIAPDAARLKRAAGEEEVVLVVHASGDGKGLADALAGRFPGAAVSGTVARGASGRVGVRIAGDGAGELIHWLSHRPDVYTIQRGHGARLRNATARRWVQGGSAGEGAETLWQRGLYGQGQVIAILDTGADWRNLYLAEEGVVPPPVVGDDATLPADPTRRKIIAYQILEDAGKEDAMDSQGHGTSVAGNAAASLLGGDQFSTDVEVQNGVAPAAQLVIQDGGYEDNPCAEIPGLGCPVIGMLERLRQAHSLGATIHNNSWGDQEEAEVQNIYTPVGMDMDLMTWEHPEFLIVCAGGNDGRRGDDSVGTPSTAKNVLSVGATNNPNANTMTTFSSNGWTEDMRFKPDLVAPGVTRAPRWMPDATEPHSETRHVAGTSMASPITAGAAALVRQYYTEGWHPTGTPAATDVMTTPSAALIKATLIAGTTPLTNEPAPPARRQGWGRVHLDNALYFEGDSRRTIVHDVESAFATAADDPHQFEFFSRGDAGAGDLVFVLCYTDYPGTPGVLPVLVNDLDLEVIGPDGAFHRGNSFDPETGFSRPGGSADRRNNVEVIRLPPAHGVYTIRIAPASLTMAGQGFALVAAGDIIDAAEAGPPDGWLLQ